MNQKQREYALQRIEQIEREKVTEVTAKFTTPGKSLSRDDQDDLIREGKVKLLPINEIDLYSYTYTRNLFDFSKYITESSLDAKKANPLIDQIEKAAQDAKDSIMLAEADDALKAIQSFETAIGKIKI